MTPLGGAIAAIASAPVLLVGSDFDGTLAPFVDHPGRAAPDPRAWKALEAIAALPHTHVAIVTGRARADVLERLPTGELGPIRVIGSHGIEAGPHPVPLSEAAALRLTRILELLDAEAAGLPGALVERKPASATLHVRRVEPRLARKAVERVVAGAIAIGDVHVLHGEQVVELCAVPPGKGRAVARLRYWYGATSAFFIGDDVTDESVFAEFGPADLGVKIGQGATAARSRIPSQADVAEVLEELLELRSQWLASRVLVPIERHALLSDQRTAALVGPDGNLVWGCFPRIDSPALFSRLLGDGSRGEFSIRPAAPLPGVKPKQEYDGDSFVLRTMWPSGLTVTDYLDTSVGRAYQRPGRSELIRVIEARAPMRVVLRFAPRLDFGRLATGLQVREEGIEVDGWEDPIVLRSPGIAWRIVDEGPHQTAEAELNIADRPVVLELRYGTGSLSPSQLPESARREQTTRFWTGWAAGLRATRRHADLVRRSALVIKSMCHGPSGAIAAAATTSLPEHLGGVRNWDYRYCWIRDSCMAAAALVRVGNTGVGLKLLDWLVQVVERTESPERLRPLYTMAGNVLSSEAEVGELPGYGQSRPVRVSNAASHQVQLDVFGSVVELVALMSEHGAPVTPEQWRLVQSMVRAVESRWEEPDHGLWEIRGPKRHHVHTKAMCWLAVDRAIFVAEHAVGQKRPQWLELRERIRADVLARGVDPERGCFTGAYGDKGVDAACLAVGLCGMVAPDDPRFAATVAAVEQDLRNGPVVYRYLGDDGLPGREGGWPMCALWLAEAMMVTGRIQDAVELIDQVAALAGPLGLMSEQFDPATRMALGNYPQVYSHLALINAIVRLESLDGASAE